MNVSVNRADLESLLRARQLDRTLTSSRERQSDRAAQVGMPDIDRQLGGGFPRGQISELVGARSTGRTTVLHALLASATARGEFVAIVDSLDTFDPASAAESGVAIDRLLWVRGPSLAHGTVTVTEGELFQRACERAIKAFNLILQAASADTPFVAVLDLAEMPASVLKRLPFIIWRRLQRSLEGRDGAGILLADTSLGRSARGLTLQFAFPPSPASSQTSPWQPLPFSVQLSTVGAGPSFSSGVSGVFTGRPS